MTTGSVVLIGVFDGVHKGHQLLLNRAKEIADGRSVIALTFDPHPMHVFAPDRAPTLLTTLSDRVELLKIHNADQVAVLKFNEKFAAMSPQDFVKDVLVGQLGASTVIVGKNFTYGHKAAGSVDSLIQDGLKFNFTVDVQELEAGDGQVISSSRIRSLVTSGEVEEARALLSRPHRLDGIVALAVGLNIIVTGVNLLRSSTAGLMDKALSDEDHLKIVKVLTKYESDEVKFHELQTREAGRQRFVSMHVLVPGAWTIQKGHDLSENLEADIIAELPDTIITTHVEPLEDERSWADQTEGQYRWR